MKKSIVWLLVLILMLSHLIPPDQVTFAEETEDECKISEFEIQTIVVSDDTIKGTGLGGQRLELELKNEDKKVTIQIEDNGKFEYELETDELDENDKIKISNDYYKIETDVALEETPRDSIKSEQYVECPIEESSEEDPAEETDTEEETEETPAEESAEEAESEDQPEESLEEDSAEEAETEKETEETPAEESAEEAESEDQPEEDSAEEAETEEETEKTPEEDSEKEAESEDQPEESPEEESTEETETEEETEKTPEEDSEKEAESERQSEESLEENSAEETETEEETEKTPEEDSEKEAESEDRPAESPEEDSTEETESEERADTEEEIAENFSVLSQTQTQNIYQSSSAPIDTIQGSAVTVTTSQQFTDAISNNDIEHIRLSNNINTSGTLNVRTRYGQKVIDANGYSINIGSGQMMLSNSSILNRDVRKLIILNASNLYTNNSAENGGMIRKRDGELSLHLENVNFNANNNSSGGILGSNWEGNINFHGNNIINTYNGGYSMAFRKVFIHQGAQVEINNYNGNSVFQFERNTGTYGDGEYGIQAETNGTLNVNSNAAVITTNLSREILRDRILTNRFGVDSDVVLSGNGSNIFPVDTTVNNFITNPQKIDFINNQSNSTLFNSNEDIYFYLSETTLKGWNRNNMENQPSNISQPITTGQFRFSGNNTTNVSLTPEHPNFSTMFTPQLRRMMFEKSISPIEVLEVADITDKSTKITGTTSANVSVKMYDKNGNVIQKVESNSNGDFSFELEEPFEADIILQFQAQRGHVKSERVEQTVIGNRLELIGVPDTIPFESTEIRNEEMIIARENPDMTVSVMDTRSNGDWHLTVRALAPLTDLEGNNTLDDALYYIEGDSEKIIEDEAVRVGEKIQSSNSNLQELSWGADEGILLKLNPVQAQAETEYSTTIEWTLTDGP